MKIDYFEKFRDRMQKLREEASVVLELHEKKKHRPEPPVKPGPPVTPGTGPVAPDNKPTRPAKETKNGKN